MKAHYHSQFDTAETYNEIAYQFHHNLYGMLAIYYDQTAVVPLDFTVRLNAMKEAVNEDIFEQSGVESEELVSKIDEVIAVVELVNEEVKKVNVNYHEALNDGDTEAAQKLYDESRSLNTKLLDIYKVAQDELLKLTWEDVAIFPHEHAQNNVENLTLSIEALNNGEIGKALDEYLWMIDNNWYAYDWDREVYDYFTDYVLDQPADRLMWGAGRVVGHVDLFDPINSLIAKRDEPNADVSKEIEVLKLELENQQKLLAN